MDTTLAYNQATGDWQGDRQKTSEGNQKQRIFWILGEMERTSNQRFNLDEWAETLIVGFQLCRLIEHLFCTPRV